MKKVLILVPLLYALSSIGQQDPQYNLYQFNQMVINPAYAGARDAVAIVADVRRQWVGFDGAPGTAAISIHSPIMNDKLGIGINTVSDRIGAKSVNGIYGNLSYILKLNNTTKLSFGARAGYAIYKFNFNDVRFKDQGENVYGDLNNSNRGALDVDAGFYLRTNTFYAGLSFSHLNRGVIYKGNVKSMNSSGIVGDHSLSFIQQPHLFFTLGKTFVFNENFLFSPSIMVKSVMRKTTADLNLNFFVAKRVWFGVFARQGYGYGALFQVYINNQFRIGYSYDFAVGKKRLLGNSHEIMLGFDINRYKSKMVSPRFL